MRRVEGADGVLLVVTTNHIEDIDSALGRPESDGRSTRPGRIDRAVHLSALDEDCRRRIALRILADCPHEVDAVVAAGNGDSGAKFQDRCAQIALAWHWSKLGAGSKVIQAAPETTKAVAGDHSSKEPS